MIEYFLDEAEQNRFRIKGENHEIVATSEPYATRSNAARGVHDLYAILAKDLGHEEPTPTAQRPDGPDGGRGDRPPYAPEPSDETSVQEDQADGQAEEGDGEPDNAA